MRLDHSQAEAVAFGQGPCMVLAGPGSGKTFTITSRISYLIDHRGVRPEDVLVITFTRYAATQMRLRFQDACEGRRLPVTFGTFHSIYFQILKKTYALTQENVLTGKEKRILLARLAEAAFKDAAGDAEAEDVRQPDLDREDFLRQLETEIGRVKNDDADPETWQAFCCDSAVFRQIFRSYEEEKRKTGKLDFEDMLTHCRDLLANSRKAREAWQKKYRYILVDEFQDCNRVQYEVLKLLAEPERNLFIVGDDDQSIYGFRGAGPKIMQTFLLDYPDARQILLDTNYRCDAQIVAGSQRVISRNQDRFPKDLHAAPWDKEEETAAGGPGASLQATGESAGKAAGKTAGKAADDWRGIWVKEFADAREESKFLTEQIRKLIALGIPAKEIAVLFRTGAEGGQLAEQLSQGGIPFRIRDWQHNPYEHFIGKDVRSYLSLADAPEKESVRTDLLRVANRPNRYLTRESLAEDRVNRETLLSYYQGKDWMKDRIRKLYADLDLIRDEPPFSAIQYIREGIGYEDFLTEYAHARHLKPEKYREVLDQIQERSRDFSTTGEWITHVDRFGEALKEQAAGEEQDGIRLMTIHSAKGLEFDTVFLSQVNEGSIPHKRAQFPAEIEEERRLFYVAMTRAKTRLVISYAKRKDGRELAPSRFVTELQRQA